MPQFKVHSEYSPAGDQPQAIEKLAQGVDLGLREQVLKGVTGSGKTYTCLLYTSWRCWGCTGSRRWCSRTFRNCSLWFPPE